VFSFCDAELRLYDGKMDVQQLTDRFQINHNFPFCKQIEPVFANLHFAILKDGHFELLLESKAPFMQFKHQSIFIN